MTCQKCDKNRAQFGSVHRIGEPCDICNDTGTDYIGRPCRHCSRPENEECRTCGGRRKVEGMNHQPGDLLFACPDCTPENVEDHSGSAK